MGKLIDLTGQQVGRLVVKWRSPQNIRRKPAWLCLCACGNETTVSADSLRSLKTQSCGCLHRERSSENAKALFRRHGRTASSEWVSWSSMRSRCYNENATGYGRYGGRGVKVCDRWRESFDAFFADMGPRPSSDHSLDRWPNKTGDYEPGNCRWATRLEQANNRQDNVIVTYNGETTTLRSLLRQCGAAVSRRSVVRRIKRGWPHEAAINAPPTREAACQQIS